MANVTLQNPQRRHACLRCNKVYTKAEHLMRHERTHTGLKPFSCSSCNRSFSRHDSLVRHIKRHNHGRAANARVSTSPSATLGVVDVDLTLQQSVDYTSNNLNRPHPAQQRQRLQQERDFLDTRVPARQASAINDVGNDVQLNWPDSEDLLQSILSADWSQWPQFHEVVPGQSTFIGAEQSPEQTVSPFLTPDGMDSMGHGGNHAVRNLSQMITTLSADVTAEADSVGLNTVFLDGCLHMFFNHFITSFPVVHKWTFVFRDWTHPLLLNAIALGSLFVGQKGNVAKGETLWRLAHTVVATSWHTLIQHRGPYDTTPGIQLVLTALLGQVYAIFSQNVTLRKTAQIFHSLGFYWARECGMYEQDDGHTLEMPLNGSTNEQNIELWKLWAAKETQLRALLGHYILDGQIAQYTGGPTCQRHSSNPLPLPCDDQIFEAASAEDWLSKMKKAPARSTTFNDLFSSLFSVSIHVQYLSSSMSYLTVSVVLEGLKSFVSESKEVTTPTVGVPPKKDISRALGRLHKCIISSQQMSSLDKSQSLLRWHAISIDAATDSGILCRQICDEYNIEQILFGRSRHKKTKIDLRTWTGTAQARRSLLHAVTIWEILQDLPFGRAHAIHIPASVFVAAIIYSAFCLAGMSTTAIPAGTDWERIMTLDLETFTVSPDNYDLGPDSQIIQYLSQEHDSVRRSQSARNLLYELNLLPLYLKGLSAPWGVTRTMEEILQQLVTLCSS